MSKLLKSKFIFGSLVAVVALFAASSASAAYMHTVTLKMGSNNAQVMSLQQTLNLTTCKVGLAGTAGGPGSETNYFGAKTAAAVKCFQASKGLTADGIVGPMTGAALATVTGSAALPAGCTSTAGYSPLTGVACNSSTPSTLPAGCTSTAGYSPTTGQSCSGGSTPSTGGPLQGGAGSITIDDSNAFTSEEVEEGEEDVEVLEFSVEADDESDVEVTSIKVELVNADDDSSADLDDYAESVSVWFGGKKVGEADVDSFSENGDAWSKSISLDGAVVRAGDEEDFVVAVSALNVIDSDDTGTDEWEIDVTNVRFEDGEGVVTTESGFDSVAQDFDFEPAGANEELNFKTSSNDPDASTLLVDEDDESEWYEVFVFRIEAEESDIDLHDLVLTVTTDTEDYDEVVAEVMIEIDGEEFDDYDVVAADTTTADLTFDIDGDFTIDADDTVEVVVMMKFLSSDNYTSGSTTVQVMTVSVEGEGADDVEDIATVTGEEHTLSDSTATVSNVSWSSSKTDTTGIIDFFFTVSAEEDDFDVLVADILDDATGTAFTDTAGEPETGAFGVLSRISGDSVVTLGDDAGFTVAEGDTTRFRVRYNAAGEGSYEVNITSVAGQALDEDDELSPTIILED